MTNPELDAAVVQEALWGEPPGSGRAFCRLYEHYEPQVRFAVARAAHRAAYFHPIDELRQEVWMRLLDRDRQLLRYYKPECGALGPFLSRIAYQQALHAMKRDHWKSIGRRRPLDETLVDEEASRFAADIVQSDVYDKIMARAVAELDDLDRLLLHEVYLGLRRIRDVAREHDLDSNRLYKRHQRLRRRLAAWGDELLASAEATATQGAVATTVLVAVILAGLADPSLGWPSPPDAHSPAPVTGGA
ncbi:MAG: sigma-70 family RNA polymerase sigma factor [Myxococcales bacterium]|nr:sigma-70 family RNA polymerase sigma factor [Myxococcales bacterium]